jgi:hypothetical protein
MEGLPTSILPGEARFAYVASPFRLAEIYVPFVDVTEARNAPDWDTPSLGYAVGEARISSGTPKAVEEMAKESPLFSEQVGSGEWRPEKKPRGRTPG